MTDGEARALGLLMLIVLPVAAAAGVAVSLIIERLLRR